MLLFVAVDMWPIAARLELTVLEHDECRTIIELGHAELEVEHGEYQCAIVGEHSEHQNAIVGAHGEH